jgi:hypothetical protein
LQRRQRIGIVLMAFSAAAATAAAVHHRTDRQVAVVILFVVAEAAVGGALTAGPHGPGWCVAPGGQAALTLSLVRGTVVTVGVRSEVTARRAAGGRLSGSRSGSGWPPC